MAKKKDIEEEVRQLLLDERAAHVERIAAIDAVFDESGDVVMTVKKAGVGSDKIELVRGLIREIGQIPQASIAHEFEPPLNSGTVSKAIEWLASRDEIEEITGRSHGKVWRWRTSG